MQRMAAIAGLLVAAANVVAEGRLRFLYEPALPAPAATTASVATPGLLARPALAAASFQDDVEWSRRQREIARQEMWLYYRIGVGAYQRPSARFENFEAMEFDADFDAGLLTSFAVGGRYRIWDVGPLSRVGMRVELEGLFGYTPYDRLVRGGGPLAGDGDMFEYGFSVNVMPDVKLGRVSL